MHRRKTSKEKQDYENDELAGTPTTMQEATTPEITVDSDANGGVNGNGHGLDGAASRTRVHSTPTSPMQQNYRGLGFSSPGPSQMKFPSLSMNGIGGPPISPMRPSFSHSHSRTRSVSGQTPPSRLPPSPLSTSFSARFPEPTPLNGAASSEAPQNSRRHARIHSRNLSVFFPRPGAIPTPIAEDGGQEVEYSSSSIQEEAPVTLIPPANTTQKRLGEGFTFGGRPNGVSTVDSIASVSRTVRRGHHHKHSLSHNFFSFMEPGSQELHVPNSMSQSNSTDSDRSPITPFSAPSVASNSSDRSHQNALHHSRQTSIPIVASLTTLVQFALGAAIWVSGQQTGSLGCTGLGYWVVFDAFGVGLEHVLPAYLSFHSMHSQTRRAFGNARIETLMLFSQSVYLIFSSVYVCKETVEHLLLSAGEGHHHHRGDEEADINGIEFPFFLILATLVSMVYTCIYYNNHIKLVRATGHRLPSLTSFFQSSRSRNLYNHQSPTTSILASILRNPFTTAPLIFSLIILWAALFLPPSQHRPLDLVLASIETIITFSVAYPACVILGTVLLQTSPERGLPGGRMEAFLRVMREIERHPHVLHLPAPHIWQITPTTFSSSITSAISSSSPSSDPSSKNTLVVTVELHVRKDLADQDVLSLTRWAHDRCKGALSLAARTKGTDEEAEITVGIVKG